MEADLIQPKELSIVMYLVKAIIEKRTERNCGCIPDISKIMF